MTDRAPRAAELLTEEILTRAIAETEAAAEAIGMRVKGGMNSTQAVDSYLADIGLPPEEALALSLVVGHKALELATQDRGVAAEVPYSYAATVGLVIGYRRGKGLT